MIIAWLSSCFCESSFYNDPFHRQHARNNTSQVFQALPCYPEVIRCAARKPWSFMDCLCWKNLKTRYVLAAVSCHRDRLHRWIYFHWSKILLTSQRMPRELSFLNCYMVFIEHLFLSTLFLIFEKAYIFPTRATHIHLVFSVDQHINSQKLIFRQENWFFCHFQAFCKYHNFCNSAKQMKFPTANNTSVFCSRRRLVTVCRIKERNTMLESCYTTAQIKANGGFVGIVFTRKKCRFFRKFESNSMTSI